MAREETIEVLKGQRDALKRKLDAHNRWAIKPAALALFILGLAILAMWLLTDSGSSMSMLILLTGIAVIALAILLYFLSPSRFLRAEVADAIALSNVRNLNKTLTSMLIEQKGIYIPAILAGSTRVFFPVTGGEFTILLPKTTSIFLTSDDGTKGVVMEPPGYGLLTYARESGATFTDEGLENEIRDALENSMELAGPVSVKRDEGKFIVSMGNLANAGICTAVRRESQRTCAQVGCPICSFVACMIVEGTGRMVRIESVSVKGNIIEATFIII